MLRIVQAIAALMLVTYGFLVGAMPVAVANVIAALAAVYSSFAPARSTPTAQPIPREYHYPDHRLPLSMLHCMDIPPYCGQTSIHCAQADHHPN
jgi:hypothetical protein